MQRKLEQQMGGVPRGKFVPRLALALVGCCAGLWACTFDHSGLPFDPEPADAPRPRDARGELVVKGDTGGPDQRVDRTVFRDACVPTGAEVCDGYDNDCNGTVDDNVVCPKSTEQCCAGRCTDTASNLQHCGKCGRACPSSVQNGYPLCSFGSCKLGCKSGYADCDKLESTGCEADLSSDPNNCGACDNKVNTLTDAKNCGRCGHDCLGGGCKNGLCQAVKLADTDDPVGVAVDGTHVYWTAAQSGNVQRVKKAGSGGTVETLWRNQSDPTRIVVDSTHVYWANAGGQKVVRGEKSGLTSKTLAYGQKDPAGIAVDATRVYWTLGRAGGSIRSIAKSGGGTPTNLATGQSKPITVVVDGKDVFWINEATKELRRVGTDGKGEKVLATGQTYPVGLAVDATHVYWTDGAASGAVRRVLRSGGTPTTLARNQPKPSSVVAVGGVVYWTNAGDGTLRYRAIASSAIGTLVTKAGLLHHSLTSDGSALYWATTNPKNVNVGAIWKVAR